jgi:hypothetical protein
VHGIVDEVRRQLRAGQLHLCPERRDEAAALGIHTAALTGLIQHCQQGFDFSQIGGRTHVIALAVTIRRSGSLPSSDVIGIRALS